MACNVYVCICSVLPHSIEPCHVVLCMYLYIYIYIHKCAVLTHSIAPCFVMCVLYVYGLLSQISIELCSAVCTHMYMCCSPTFNEAMLCDVCTFVYRLYPHSIEPCQSMCVVYVYVIFFLCDQALWYMVCMNVYVLFICIQ